MDCPQNGTAVLKGLSYFAGFYFAVFGLVRRITPLRLVSVVSAAVLSVVLMNVAGNWVNKARDWQRDSRVQVYVRRASCWAVHES